MRMKTVLFALISIFLPLLLIEGGVRLVASDYIESRTSFVVWLEDMADELVTRTSIDGRDVYYSAYLPTPYYRDEPKINGNVVDAIKGPKTFRILVVGGSVVAGSPFGHWGSFVRFLNDGLTEIARPGAKVEVMNLGMSSGSTTTVRLVLSHLDKLTPDLVIVYAGSNEICDADAALKAAGVARESKPRFGKRMANWVARYSATYRLLKIAVKATPKEELFRAYPCPSANLPLDRRSDLDILTGQYRENIAATVDLAKNMGAEVLLVEEIVNLLARPAEGSSRSARETRQPHKAMARAFNAGDADGYARSREAVLAADPESALPLFYDGLRALADGRNAEARALLEAALSSDRRPIRARPAYRQVLTAIAAADQAVSYVEITRFLSELVPDGIADGRLFLDENHPTIELNRLIADKIIRAHFAANEIRPDLFTYARYDGGAVYRAVPEEERYGLICKRFFGLTDWRECIEKGLTKLKAAKDSGDFPRYRRAVKVWEHLFYYGRVNNDAAALVRSRELFRPRTPDKPPR